MVVKDLTGPISEEFAKISYDLKYGLYIIVIPFVAAVETERSSTMFNFVNISP